MIKTLGQTANFVIQYQDSFTDALRRAQALQHAVEGDFAKLLNWFDISGRNFGPGNRVTLSVDQEALAKNYGYKRNGLTFVRMDPFQGASDQGRADDAVRALFVAEIVEVLMSYNNEIINKVGWAPRQSDGEGLSRVCAALFYPNAYYDPRLINGPFVNPWISSPEYLTTQRPPGTAGIARNDWIGKNEVSDRDIDSFGCSILFIYYLHVQLGYSMHSIITKAGATLEITYQNLSGNTGGYAALVGLINPYFPPSSKTSLKTDNPFPLLQGNDRSVQLTYTQEANDAWSVDSSGTVEIRPFSFCPIAKYFYNIFNTPVRMRVTASVTGFGQPVYKWKINGQAASASNFGDIAFAESIYLDDPNDPNNPQRQNKSVTVFYSDQGDTSTWGQMQGEMDIFNSGFPGHIPLTIEVEVSEKSGKNGSISGAAFATLDTQALVYEPRYYRDRLGCEAAYQDQHQRLVRWKRINILLTLPDPPPDLMRSIRILGEVVEEIAQLQREEPALAREVIAGLAKHLGVSPRILGAATGEHGQTANG